jgi:hypothetical protein
MRDGAVAGELPAAGATEEQVLHLASGGATGAGADDSELATGRASDRFAKDDDAAGDGTTA